MTLMIDYFESHLANTTAKLNWLRASVLGANDGIVSIAGLVLGIAGVTNSPGIIFTTGMVGIIAGAISMAAGEYVSVSSSRDSEKALIKKERKKLREHPEQELEKLILIYEKKGLSKKTATSVANELTKHDPIAAHLDAKLNIDPENLTSPTHAALASALSFLIGGIIPLIAISIPPLPLRIPATVISVVLALATTGSISAQIGGASILRATARVVLGGIFAMAITYGIGRFFGVSRI